MRRILTVHRYFFRYAEPSRTLDREVLRCLWSRWEIILICKWSLLTEDLSGFSTRFPVMSTEVGPSRCQFPISYWKRPKISYPINTYIAGVDAALSSLKHSRDQDIAQAVMGILSVRFTSSTSATLSPSYSKDPSKSAGRCYLEIYGLSNFYKRFQTFDDIIRPIQEQAINNYLVCLPLFMLVPPPHLSLVQARLHWGQCMSSTFKAQQYWTHDPEFASNIAAVRKIANKYDPGHMMTNTFLDQVVFTTWLILGIQLFVIYIAKWWCCYSQ